MIEIKVLGTIQAFRDGTLVDLGGPTQRRLLAALIARPREIVPVTTLLGDLWGDDPPPSGTQSIQSYVSRLRRGLGSDVIETKAPGYRLGPARVDLDSSRFIELATNLPSDDDARLTSIDEALGLWDGPPFEDFEHVDFATHRLNETRLDLEEDRGHLLASTGRTAEALAALEKITSEAPLRESAWVALSKVLLGAGRQADAVRVLDRYRDSLADIGLEPGPSFVAAQDDVFSAPSAPAASALPRVETSFVGRRREVEELRRLLGTGGLVTITGAGGMGKSRLALEVLRDWDGLPVHVTRLAGLRSDSEVAPTALHAVGGEARGDPVDAIVSRLGRDPALLLLDNAEHVIEGAATLVAQILTRTSARILVTSREPLNVLGEATLDLDSMEPQAAIELYRDRARMVDPDFSSSPATLDMLCEELDYMPLAIEMAAARSKALAPEEILTRLSRKFGLLDKPLRGGTGRHRSLDSLVDWSYGLLEDTEKRVFERLSVIAGTFDVDTASGVAGFGEIPSDIVPAALASLVEKSLVRRTSDGSYRILRVLKSFAEKQLKLTDDWNTALDAHARWFGRVAGQIGSGLSTSDETTWIDIANEAVDDLGLALTRAIEMSDVGTAQEILEGLFDWLYHRHPPAIIDWGDQVLPISGGHDAHSVASAWAAVAAIKRDDIDTAREIALSGTDVDGPASRFAWFMVGDVACYQDRLEDARAAFRKQIVRASNVNDAIGVVDGVAGETIALAFQGQFDHAVELAADLAGLASGVGAPTYRAYSIYAEGEAIVATDPEEASRLLEQAAELAASVNNEFIQAMARTSRGSVLALLSRHDEAIADLHRAASLWDGLVVPNYQWVVVHYLGAVLAELGNETDAVRLVGAAEAAGRAPFKAGQAHWLDAMESLKSVPNYEALRAEGANLSLNEASELALDASRTAIQLRR